jgi:TonB family protein
VHRSFFVALVLACAFASAPSAAMAKQNEVRGSLSREQIRDVVRMHLTEVRGCYERELVANPALTGRVTVHFVIGASGRVTSATVESSTMPDTAVAACVEQAILTWIFPPPDGGGVVAVSYPFVFEPEN